MKIALVHDYLIQYGGAERVLEAFSEIFPRAPIYTLIYDKELTGGIFEGKRIYTSSLQKIPLIKNHHRLFLTLMPLAIEQFDLSFYDVVLSDSASYAKGIITKPDTLHICYCHTPLRYAWDDSHRYIKEFYFPPIVKKFIPLAINHLRIWDREAAFRVDKFIANSFFVQRRIKKYYQRDSEVIYPPVATKKFEVPSTKYEVRSNEKRLKLQNFRLPTSDFFLMVGRLLPYKRFDLAIKVFNKLGWKLKIIGEGPERKKLKKIALSNIEFLGKVSDEELVKYYSQALAFIFPQEEDLGIVALEAMASGKPVIAYKSGGAKETVIEGKTGLFFEEQTPSSLEKALLKFNTRDFNPKTIRKYALQFDKRIFKSKIKNFIEKSLYDYRH